MVERRQYAKWDVKLLSILAVATLALLDCVNVAILFANVSLA